MSTPLTGKAKAARVPLGYYERTGRVRKNWAWAIFGALLLLAFGAAAFGYWRRASSPGPIHSAHAAWEDNCSMCHKGTAQPTGSNNGFNLFRSKRDHPSNDLCKQCHMGHVDQQHHAREKEAEVGSCASCHMDHRGRGSFMTRVADAKCTFCHADLKNHVDLKGGTLDWAERVTRFDYDHPEFRVRTADGTRVPLDKAPEDPGRLRFNHQLHMAPGLQVEWTFSQIGDSDLRGRYMEQHKQATGKTPALKDAMKLECASCHRLDATDEIGRKGPARSTGEYMLPVTYEQHCRACHPLTFSSALPKKEIPHHLKPAEVKEFLRGAFTEAMLTDGPAAKQFSDTDRPIPGPNVPRKEFEEWKKATIGKAVEKAEKVVYAKDDKDSRGMLKRIREGFKAEDEKLDQTALFTFLGRATCGLCHYYEQKNDSVVPAAILPTNVPEVWQPHSKFSHRSHRTVQCADCHKNVETSTSEKAVLMPLRSDCVVCHSSARTEGGQKRGGVRQECTTCHRYHHGDAPLSGRGADARGVMKRIGGAEWLSGDWPKAGK